MLANLPPVARTLLKAADIIRERGWCRNSFQTSDGRLCLWGAINIALGAEAADFHPEGLNVLQRVDVYLNAPGEDWNDTRGRTVEEVISALEGVAAQVASESVDA